MNHTEKVARALCWANGQDPDLSLSGDEENYLWMVYESFAIKAIKAAKLALPIAIFFFPWDMMP